MTETPRSQARKLAHDFIQRGDAMGWFEVLMPWPLTRAEFALFQASGLQQVRFEDYLDQEESPTRRFRVQYRRESASHEGKIDE